MADEFGQWIEQRKIIIFLGSGGVGKTSCSLGFAVKLAREGKTVGLLSIDPARRLAAALGVNLGSELQNVEFGLKNPLKGKLMACMLDQKAVFDKMVEQHAPDEITAKNILKNRLYIAASEKLAGVGEYMALAKLQEMIDMKFFDLIILDTPPETHALDFLQRPNILSGFMERKIINWLVKPFHMTGRFGIERIFSVGEHLMGGLSKITGFQTLYAISEFILLMQQVIEGFHSSGEKIKKTLAKSDSGFVLVSVCQNASLRSGRYLSRQLVSLGYSLDGVFFNRSLPNAVEKNIHKIESEKPNRMTYLSKQISQKIGRAHV